MQVLSVHGASGSTPLRLATSTKKIRNIKIISKHVLGFDFTLNVYYRKYSVISTIPYQQK